MTDEVAYRTYDPAEIQVRYACPFCIRVAVDTTDELLAHVGQCDFYHALDENLPVSPPEALGLCEPLPASAIVIDPDVPYTLEEYLSDEILYFELMKSVSAVWPPATPANLDDAESYFEHVISENTNTPLTAQRRKNLVFRFITTFYKVPQHILQSFMASAYSLQVEDT